MSPSGAGGRDREREIEKGPQKPAFTRTVNEGGLVPARTLSQDDAGCPPTCLGKAPVTKRTQEEPEEALGTSTAMPGGEGRPADCHLQWGQTGTKGDAVPSDPLPPWVSCVPIPRVVTSRTASSWGLGKGRPAERKTAEETGRGKPSSCPPSCLSAAPPPGSVQSSPGPHNIAPPTPPGQGWSQHLPLLVLGCLSTPHESLPPEHPTPLARSPYPRSPHVNHQANPHPARTQLPLPSSLPLPLGPSEQRKSCHLQRG